MNRDQRVKSFRSVGLVLRGAAMGLALAAVAAWPRLSAQEPTPAPGAPPCDSCDDQAQRRLERDLARAREALERSQQALADALQAARASTDSTGTEAEELARAHGEMRRAQERYNVVLSRLMATSMARAQVENDRAMRAMRMQLRQMQMLPRRTEGWIGLTFSCDCSVQSENGHETWHFSDYPTVEAVEPESPAERAGVEAGDRITAVGGQDLVQAGTSFLSNLKPGKQLDLRIKRGRISRNLTLLVGKRPESEWTLVEPPAQMPAMAPTPAMPAMPATPVKTPGAPMPPEPAEAPILIIPPSPPLMGMTSDSGSVSIFVGSGDQLTVAGAQMRRLGSLRDYFGVSDGVLVLRVVRGSVAYRAGLRDGDVIVRADGRSVNTPGALAMALVRASDNSVKLDVVRKKAPRTLVMRWKR